ncbi:glycosyltransferase [candidate division KSB1 bacterium]|nr:glycosyltransferase [candidate division KSB1 bacterium]
MPLVSVIIPTYNRAPLLSQAMESVLEQSIKDFELIVIDDGSTDDTREILRPFLPRIQYFFQQNQGISVSRNKGIQISRGEYICFLDSDDSWHRHKLRRQLGFFPRNPDAWVCYTDEVWIRGGRRVNPKRRHQKYSGWIFDKVLPLCIVSLSSAMMKRELLARVGPFDESLPVCEDYDFWIRVASCYPIHFIPEPLITKWGGHGDQLSKKYPAMDRFRVRALEKALAANTLSSEQKRLVLKELVKKCCILQKGYAKREKTPESQMYLERIGRYEEELENPAGG